uniref:C-type natriuretic peptide 3 n=1 Tax=Polypterus endlicherii TaxID=348150 RepID=Q1XGY8_9ACTI|nr:C-type natriuretic peptide 3 [Polypterus endlicherii]
MVSRLTVYCALFIIVLSQVSAKPVSSLQSFAQLLEDESNHPYVDSDDDTRGGLDVSAEIATDDSEADIPWNHNFRDLQHRQAAHSSRMLKLLKDILTSSGRSWDREKKSGLRSCFGVRLDRIGSMSGLGC